MTPRYRLTTTVVSRIPTLPEALDALVGRSIRVPELECEGLVFQVVCKEEDK